MEIKYLDNNIPINYSLPIEDSSLEKNKGHQGRIYTLLGKSEETLSLGHRIWVGVRSIIESVLFPFFGEKGAEDRKAFWEGKRPVILYGSAFLSNKFLADQGHADAQFNLGCMYEKAQGVPPSDHEAIKYYQLAADQGHAGAQYNLGIRYAKGQGVPPSDHEAIKYYQLAANQGHVEAQIEIGHMYEEGRGVAQSDQKALKYYILAADQGNQNAINRLKQLRNKMGIGVGLL